VWRAGLFLYDPTVPSDSPLRLTRLRVRFPRPRLDDIDAAVREQLERHRDVFPASGSIAIGVGSRGIANIDRIARTAAAVLASWDLRPFIVPAMGSHGGATAEGQRQLLQDYGITEAACGCPIRSDMAVVELDGGGLPYRVFMDRNAASSDGVLLINRIKPHTDFHGAHESGLAKMAVIGLGKEAQAAELHRAGVAGLRDGMPRVAEHVLATGRILAGLGIVENAYDDTMALELLPAADIMAREPQLLTMARRHMPALPADPLDVLIVDRLGKDISGTGLDTNVIGRMRIPGEPEPASPRIRSIVVTDLTDGSHGNATGTGLADVVTKRLFDKIDVQVTYTNVYTSGFVERGKIPVVAPTDAAAYQCALRACGPLADGTERVARIRDTLHPGDLYVSAAVYAELHGRPDIEVVGDAVEIFDADGTLRPF
jgi:hypothetical protein